MSRIQYLVQLYALSLVSHAHAATAQFLDDAVVRNGLADHSWRILRLRNGQVNESRGVGGVQKGCWRKIPLSLIDWVVSGYRLLASAMP